MVWTAQMLLFFFLYACLGWMVEVAFAAITTGKLVNRGFLNGPVCPIYGFGMVSLVLLCRDFEDRYFPVFLTGLVVCTLIELVGGWALYKIYHARWWDYSNYRFNLGGYICPQFSFLWGLGSVVMICFVHRGVERLVLLLPTVALFILAGLFLAVFAVDVCVSGAAAMGLNRYLAEIDQLRAALRTTSDRLTVVIGTRAITADELLDEQRLQLMLASMEGRENAEELREQLADLAHQIAALREKMEKISRERFFGGAGRLLQAFPDMKTALHAESLAEMRQYTSKLRVAAKAARDAAKNAVRR